MITLPASATTRGSQRRFSNQALIILSIVAPAASFFANSLRINGWNGYKWWNYIVWGRHTRPRAMGAACSWILARKLVSVSGLRSRLRLINVTQLSRFAQLITALSATQSAGFLADSLQLVAPLWCRKKSNENWSKTIENRRQSRAAAKSSFALLCSALEVCNPI